MRVPSRTRQRISTLAPLLLLAAGCRTDRLTAPMAAVSPQPPHTSQHTAIASAGYLSIDIAGDVGGGSQALGINAGGTTVGYSVGTGARQAWVRSASGTVRQLPSLSSGPSSIARAINASGIVTGSSHDDAGAIRAVVWRPDGTIQDLGTIDGVPGTAEAHAINDAGQVVGESRSPRGGFDGFIWSADRGMRMLNTPDQHYCSTAASGVAADGTAVGWGCVGNSEVALLWPADGSPAIELGNLYGVQSRAYAVSADGSIVVGAVVHPDLQSWTVARWHAGTWTDLGIPFSTYATPAIAISPDGSVIAGGDPRGAYVWSASAGRVQVGTVPNSQVSGINGDGVMVGYDGGGPDATIFAPSGTVPVDVTIDPGQFPGYYRLNAENQPDALTWGTGVRSVKLLPGRYGLSVLESVFALTVAQDGTVTADDPRPVTGGSHRATINTVSVTVDPVDFPLQYALHDSRFVPSVGKTVFQIPPACTFAVGVGTDYLVADIDGAGNVTSKNPDAATGSLRTLTFNTVPIVVDPGAFNSVWTLHGGPLAVGPQTVPLVRNTGFSFQFGDAPKTFPSFFVDPAGNTSPRGTTGLLGGSGRITFRNVVAHVTTSVPGATWQLHGGSYTSGAFIAYGDHDVVLIPDVGFLFERSDVAPSADNYFVVGDPCSITPHVFVIASVTYTMACGPLVPPDVTPPVITPQVAGTMGREGWYVSDVTISWSVGDPESGIKTSSGCTGATVSQDTGGVTFTCSATNGAGLSARNGVSVKRDATPPTLAFSGNQGSYTVDQQVSIGCNASDALSGIASFTCPALTAPAYQFAAGQNSFNGSAVDHAGNVTTAAGSFLLQVTADGMCTLVTRMVSNAGIAHSLCVKLQHHAIEPFRNELSAQTGKSITDANAAALARLVGSL